MTKNFQEWMDTDDHDVSAAVDECLENPFDDSSRQKVANEISDWIGLDRDGEDDCIISGVMESVAFLSAFRVHDAAVQWVRENISKEDAHKLDGILDDKKMVKQLSQRRADQIEDEINE